MRKVLKGRYQIVEKLGQGTSGQVYKVWDIILEKHWALKEFPEKEKQEEAEKNMELEVLKKISHPSFPRIVDVFREEKRSYFVMDYVEGRTLADYMLQSVLGEEQILEIAIKLAEALLFLHQQNPCLLYLDLKPSNIMLEETGILKIVDFGSVIVKGRRVMVSGTPGYASPEQMNLVKEGSMLSEQSDIYSLGMVLFSMLRKEEKNLPLINRKQKQGVIISKYQPVVSKKTERIIEKATRGDVRKRYGSMREMLIDLKKGKEALEGRKKQVLLGRRNLECSSLWHQKRSILCCDGKTIFSVFKSIMGVLVILLIFQGSAQAKEEKKFQVFIKDQMGRKVLVKKGCAYEVTENLHFEIPEEIMEEKFQIKIQYLREGRKIEEFKVDCIKKEKDK